MTNTQFIISFLCAFAALVSINAFMFNHLLKAEQEAEGRR